MSPSSDEKPAATEELVPIVYDELRRVARRYFRNQPPGFTLRPTELVDEACMHLMQHGRREWTSAAHFRAIASQKICQVVIDHVRRRRAAKRGGGRAPQAAVEDRLGDEAACHGNAQQRKEWQRIPLDAVEVEWNNRAVDLLDLADALEALRLESRRLSDVVQLHWFGGLTYADAAGYLNVSASTVERDFRYALGWLNRRLSGANGDGD